MFRRIARITLNNHFSTNLLTKFCGSLNEIMANEKNREMLLLKLFLLKNDETEPLFNLPLKESTARPTTLGNLIEAFKDGGDHRFCPKAVPMTINAFIKMYGQISLPSIPE
ncbi:MAG: hypothetical protein O3A01_04015 [bacterium]|nr:hypothetical protein [bacterium]